MAAWILKQTNKKHLSLLIGPPPVTPDIPCTPLVLNEMQTCWRFLALICVLVSLQGEDGDYQAVGSVAGMERQELNYAALEFIGGRSKKGSSGKKDDGSNYREFKAK